MLRASLGNGTNNPMVLAGLTDERALCPPPKPR